MAVDLPEKFACALREDEMGVTVADLGFLGMLLYEHPEWTTFIEFGTSRGITALLLGLAMRCRDGRLVSFDRYDVRLGAVKDAWLDNMIFVEEDLLRPDGSVPFLFTSFVEAGPCLVFCDNGNKPRELERYAPLLKVGDGICVHDWRDPHYDAAEISPVLCPAMMSDITAWKQERWEMAVRCGADVRAWVRA